MDEGDQELHEIVRADEVMSRLPQGFVETVEKIGEFVYLSARDA